MRAKVPSAGRQVRPTVPTIVTLHHNELCEDTQAAEYSKAQNVSTVRISSLVSKHIDIRLGVPSMPQTLLNVLLTYYVSMFSVRMIRYLLFIWSNFA